MPHARPPKVTKRRSKTAGSPSRHKPDRQAGRHELRRRKNPRCGDACPGTRGAEVQEKRLERMEKMMCTLARTVREMAQPRTEERPVEPTPEIIAVNTPTAKTTTKEAKEIQHQTVQMLRREKQATLNSAFRTQQRLQTSRLNEKTRREVSPARPKSSRDNSPVWSNRRFPQRSPPRAVGGPRAFERDAITRARGALCEAFKLSYEEGQVARNTYWSAINRTSEAVNELIEASRMHDGLDTPPPPPTKRGRRSTPGNEERERRQEE